jgi:osmotically-inducible protein OsmY
MKSPFHLAALAAAALLALSGCAALEGQDLSSEPVTDPEIAALASSRLNGDSMVASATLSVTVEDGLAILKGTVPNEAVRLRAISILEGTPGIYEVLDRTRRR